MRQRKIEVVMAALLLLAVLVMFKTNYLPAGVVSKGKGIILIDPGHGGDDPGVIGVDNIKEKDLNLEISMKLKKRFKQAGYQVVMTREEDKGLYEVGSRNKKVQDMQNRCKLIEETKPICTISVHQNSYPDASVKGPQVFYYTHSNEGKELAKSIQEQVNTSLEIERPRVEKGNNTYYMLKRSASPTVIVECGFLSNPEESKKLLEKDYQEKIVRAIVESSEKYIDTHTKK